MTLVSHVELAIGLGLPRADRGGVARGCAHLHFGVGRRCARPVRRSGVRIRAGIGRVVRVAQVVEDLGVGAGARDVRWWPAKRRVKIEPADRASGLLDDGEVVSDHDS